MGVLYREELVGKRFLVVSGLSKPKISKISEWKWRAGVIRAVDKSSRGKDAIVYVEVDSLDWEKREWLKVQDPSHQAFLVEKSLVWGERVDPYADKPNTVRWPALSFEVLVDRVGISSSSLRPLEFLVDQHLLFVKDKEIQVFKDDNVKNSTHPIFQRYPEVRDETQKWLREQKEQYVLMHAPYQLTGVRVKVYRLGSTTQWFTAVITWHDVLTRELIVMDDTVLESHTENPSHIQMMFLDDVVNSLQKGENIGITRRTNRIINNPTVTSQPTSTTHTRTIPRSHSPSHAPSGPQTTVVSSSGSSASGGTTTTSSKKKRKDKDVPPVTTQPAAPEQQPEKAEKTIEKPGKEKTSGSYAVHKSKKERKRKSDEQVVEEEKKLPSSTPEKRPRSNSGNSESSQERVELNKGESVEPRVPNTENIQSESVSKPEKAWQSNAQPVPVECKPREDSDVSCNSGKVKNRAANKQEPVVSRDTNDSRSSTPDSTKRHKHKTKKEHKNKQPESVEVTPQETPASDQSRVSLSTGATTTTATVTKPMVESKTESSGPAGLRPPPLPEKELNRKRENYPEFPSTALREQSLTSAIAGIIARELNRDNPDVLSSVGKKTEPSSVPSNVSVQEVKPVSVSQETSSISSGVRSGLNDRPVNSGPITTTPYTTNNHPHSVLPNRTIATTSNSVPVISRGNGGLTGMDRNSSGITSENTKLSNSTNHSAKLYAGHPVLGERIERPEARDSSRETSSTASEKSEGSKSSSTDRGRESDQPRLEKKAPLVADLSTPVQVYRDPNLSDSEVIHVDSIQHHPAHLMKVADHHTPSPGQHPITPSPSHSALRNPSATAPASATAAPSPANPSAIVASPSAFVAAQSVGHIPSHHAIQHHGPHAMFPAHLQLYQQHPLVVPGHFPQHHLAGLDRHSLQQLHAQGIVGLVQPDPLTRIRMGGIHGIVSPQHAATALQSSLHPGLTPAQLQALHQQHPGLPLPPSWVIQHEELERAHLQQQQKSQAAAAAAASEKSQSALSHHPSAPPPSQVRMDPTAAAAADKKAHTPHLPAGAAAAASGTHPQHHVHPQLIAATQSSQAAAAAAAAAAQGLVAGHESAAAAAAAAHHARHQYQELDAQAAVQQHFQESLRKLQVPFSFSAPTTGGSITEGTALPKNKGQLPKEVLDRQHKERQEHEERLRREREEKELEWQRIQREKERKHQDTDPRLRFPESESLYKHPVSEGKHPYDEPLYRQSLAHAGLVRYQEDFTKKYPVDLKHEPKIKLERTTELNARTHDGQGFKAYHSSVRSDTHTTYYNTLSMKSEEPRAGVPVRTEHNRQMTTSAAYKPKPDNLVGYQPFRHTISSHGGGGEKAEHVSKHSEEYKMAANAAAMQGARRGGAIPTPPPLIKREPEIALHSSVIQASRGERRQEVMHHHSGAVFTAASSAHDIHLVQAGKHAALSDARTNNDVSHTVPVIKHTIGTPPPLHSSAQTTASHLVRQSHIPPQSPLKVATPQQLSAAVLQLGSHSVSSTTTTTMAGAYAHQVYSNVQTTTSSSSLLMSALRPQEMTRVGESMEVDSGTMKRKPSHTAAVFHKKRPKTKDDATHGDVGNSDKKESTGMSYIEKFHNFVVEPNAHNTSVGNATVCKASENIELKIEKVDQYKRLSLDSSAPASLMSAESHRTTNGTWSDGESNRCISPRSTASDSSEGRSLKSASPHRAGGPVSFKKAWLARHSESKTPFGVNPSSAAPSVHNLDPKHEQTKLSNSLPNGHLMSGTFAQVAQSVDADKSVTIDDIPKSIPNHVYDFDQDKSSTCSEASTVSSHKSRSRKSGKDRSSKKKDRKRHGSPADSKKKDKGDKGEEKLSDVEKPKSEYVLGLEACRIMSNNVESKSTQQITELLNLIAQTPKKRKLTRSSKDNKDGQLNRPLAKPTVTKLKKSGEAFLQDGYCSEITPNLMKCRECRIKHSSKQSKLNNIFCRFYAFRRLKYSNKGNLTIAGFSEPEQCDSEDLSPWLPYPPEPESNLDLETCLYILSRVGPQFCRLVQQEQQAKTWCTTPGKIAWKRAVIGVREMCDTCDTTLFNIHWTCSKCGFVVCLDCYHSKSNEEKTDENAPDTNTTAKWLKCIKDQAHQPDSLMLTQMIPGNALWDVGDLMHQVCTKWRIPSACPCLGENKPVVNGMSPTSSQIPLEWERDDVLSSTALSGHLGNARANRTPKLTSLPQSASPLDFLADIATSHDNKSNLDKKLEQINSRSLDKACSVDVDGKGESCSTLRDLLTKTAGKLVKPSANDGNLITPYLPKVDAISKKTSRTMTSTFEKIIATVVEQNISAPGKDRSGAKTPRLSTSSSDTTSTSPGAVRLEKKGRNLANRNTLVESSVMYPDVPHSWLCDGRLLRLHDPSHVGNLRIFQEQWRKGEPILVSNCHKQLDDNLWHPSFFNKHFGHLENDLVDCRSGDVITGAPMRDFWNGFEDISNRLETKQGLPIILKLKDWPPAQDFSELLPQHFQDLMNNLPLPDYTRRDGRFNLSSRLPDFFVKPDLGPKMYNAYGLARYSSSCGTTNLHLDISDAVNVMVYVGKPHSIDGQDTCDSYEQEAIDAVDHMCMDEQTKQRVREKDERPGAIWHLFRAADTEKIRQFLVKLSEEKGEDVPQDHDPIHDQSWYLDNELLDRLYKEYGVQGWAIAQCWGDAIFIPAGAPHQVRNVHSSIKVAEDFVSPEHISQCFWLTQEFRQLSATHSNHEDKLQVKNIIYHAIKDTIGLLVTKTPPGEHTDHHAAGKAMALLQQQQQLHQQQQLQQLQQHQQQQPVTSQPQQQVPQQAAVPQQLVAVSPQSKPSPASTPPVSSSNTCSSS